MKKSARLAIVQPRNWQRSWSKAWPVTFLESDPAEATQLDEAEAYIAEAGRQGAEYLLFPEMYPGPRSLADTAFTPEIVQKRMTAAAAKAGLWVFYNGATPAAGGGQHNTCFAVSPKGKIEGAYAKMIPACGEPNVPGDAPVVIDCDGVKIGLIICWEAWFPETARWATALGAEVLFFPTGGLIYELTATWKTIIAARAAENTAFAAVNVNWFGLEDGMCAVYSPEGLVAERTGAGLLFATVDLERLRFLRASDEKLIVPKPYRAIPGLWRSLPPAVVEASAGAVRRKLKG
jgi:predicted amidohydrolase